MKRKERFFGVLLGLVLALMAGLGAAAYADTCTSIGAGAFKDCAKLEQIRVPANCAIGDGAFSGCGTVFVYAPAGSPAETWCSNPANANCIFCEE